MPRYSEEGTLDKTGSLLGKQGGVEWVGSRAVMGEEEEGNFERRMAVTEVPRTFSPVVYVFCTTSRELLPALHCGGTGNWRFWGWELFSQLLPTSRSQHPPQKDGSLLGLHVSGQWHNLHTRSSDS